MNRQTLEDKDSRILLWRATNNGQEAVVKLITCKSCDYMRFKHAAALKCHNASAYIQVFICIFAFAGVIAPLP
jgi:hypothetical protein